MRISPLSTLAAASFFFSSVAMAAEVGETLKQLKLLTHDERPSEIPDLGKKVIAVFYNDADVADLNDPIADGLKKVMPDLKYYRGLGIANLQDSKAPNFLIRSIVAGKVEKYKSIILLDPNLTLATEWKLGDVNNNAIFMIIGADAKVKYLKKGKVEGEEIEKAVKLVEQLVAELKAEKDSAEKPADPAPAQTP